MTTIANTTRSELSAPTAVTGDAVVGDMKSQASALSAHAAGLVGSRVIALGIRHGLVEAAATLEEFSADELAGEAGTDPFYTAVWCRAAFAARVLDIYDGGRYGLAPFVATLLLDKSSPTFVGGLFTIMEQPEIFDSFGTSLKTGEKTWWDQTTNEFIHAVADTGGAFNNRFIPDGMLKVPGVGVVAQFDGATMAELACGTGYGLMRAAKAFPGMHLVGLDGDSYSLEIAERRIAEAGLTDRIELVHSTMEDFHADGRYDLVTVNVSMHESRDIDAVTEAVYRSLKPGGYFLNSDFAFPSTGDGLRTVPGRIMSGIQFFEAQIDDQLVSVDFYLELLRRHGFGAVGAVEISPIHAITHGRK